MSSQFIPVVCWWVHKHTKLVMGEFCCDRNVRCWGAKSGDPLDEELQVAACARLSSIFSCWEIPGICDCDSFLEMCFDRSSRQTLTKLVIAIACNPTIELVFEKTLQWTIQWIIQWLYSDYTVRIYLTILHMIFTAKPPGCQALSPRALPDIMASGDQIWRIPPVPCGSIDHTHLTSFTLQ